MSTERQLRQLPDLAAKTLEPTDREPAGAEASARFVHPTPGPRLPPGLDLAEVDRAIGRQGSPDQLFKLSQCVRVVVEEVDGTTWRTMPNPSTEPTWASEAGWLLATMGWWRTDPWCSEWIVRDVAEIHACLIERVERGNGWRWCALCSGPITTHESELLVIAECRACDRIVSMRERPSLTTSQAAEMLGISEAAVRKRLERGQLRKVGRRGKESLVTPNDGLDWAREKLGLLARTPTM